MRCIAPLKLRIPGGFTIAPCGKCNFCLETKRSDWTFRLVQELKRSTSSYFLTLTYDDDKLPTGHNGLPCLNKQDVQLFTKRLRSMQLRRFPDSPNLRYYTVGEYGTQTHRPHYHSIMFNMQPQLLRELPEIWGQGITHHGTVTQASIHYVTKYVIEKEVDSDICPVAAMCNYKEPP